MDVTNWQLYYTLPLLPDEQGIAIQATEMGSWY